MQTITGKTSFRILGSHGVPEAEIRVLEGRFGARIPANIVGPDDVIAWALQVLPWGHVRRILTAWVTRAAKKARILDDRRIARVLQLLWRDDACRAAAEPIFDDLEQLMVTFARTKGLDPEAEADALLDRADLDDEFKAWVCAYSSVVACMEAAAGPFADGESAESAHGTIRWALAQEHPDVRPFFVDDAIKDVISAVTAFTRSWSGGSANN